MKIGILTYHKSHNYGALLQSIALRVTLQEMGHQVSFIDYWPDYHRNVYKLFSLKLMLKNGLLASRIYLLNFIKYYSSRKKRISTFNSFIEKYIQPYCTPSKEIYDIVVHGSDQIWRVQSGLGDYNPVYFGVHHDIKAFKNISYAASMDRLPNNEYESKKFLSLLKELDAISVREKNIQEYLSSNGFVNSNLSLDPTLLLTKDQWLNLFNIKSFHSDKYILFYDLLKNSFERNEIEKYARSKGLKLITLYSSVREKESQTSITTADPIRFLELIFNAELVFTSSYHGLVFSLIFNKQVIASFGSRQGRAHTLLSNLGIIENLLSPCSKFPSELPVIDYSAVNAKLSQLRQPSLEYLHNNCSNI